MATAPSQLLLNPFPKPPFLRLLRSFLVVWSKTLQQLILRLPPGFITLPTRLHRHPSWSPLVFSDKSREKQIPRKCAPWSTPEHAGRALVPRP